jgi:hypothetical protein
MSNFKNVDQDPERLAEYKERQREKLVLEEYYKLTAKYPMSNSEDLLKLATLTVRNKQEG